HAELLGEAANGRERVSGAQRPALDEAAKAQGDLGSRASVDIESHCHRPSWAHRMPRPAMLSFGLGQCDICPGPNGSIRTKGPPVTTAELGTARVKRGLAEMLKG